MPDASEFLWSRRQMVRMAVAGFAACLPLSAAGDDFWNKKAAADWTSQEIDRLITKSPWAKSVKAQYATGTAPTQDGTGYPGGGQRGGGGYPGGSPGGGYPGGTGRSGGGIGIPGIGGIGIPGLGGGGRGRNTGGAPRGGAASLYEGIVRWESARPILDAMKSPLPEAFEGHYVICVSGIPLMSGRSVATGEEDDSSTSRRQEQDDLDRLKGLSSLQTKGKDVVQAGVVARQVSSGSSILLGFSRELLPLAAHDAEIAFSTQVGRLVVKAHFLPREMQYHGELAV